MSVMVNRANWLVNLIKKKKKVSIFSIFILKYIGLLGLIFAAAALAAILIGATVPPLYVGYGH